MKLTGLSPSIGANPLKSKPKAQQQGQTAGLRPPNPFQKLQNQNTHVQELSGLQGLGPTAAAQGPQGTQRLNVLA